MKHLKLFESFDHYEFGEFTDELPLESLYESITRYDFGVYDSHAEIREFIDNNYLYVSKFTHEEIQKMKLVTEDKFDLDAVDNWWTIHNDIYDVNEISLYSLGDYCYVITLGEFDSSEYGYRFEKMYVIDEFENLLIKLEEIVNGGLLNEGISRYNFGKYTNPEEITAMFNSFEEIGDQFDELGNFTQDDIIQIDNSFSKFPGSFYHLNKSKNTITFHINGMHYLAFALGDYCYGFFVEDSTIGNIWTYCEIMDGIDRLCEVMEEIISSFI